MPEKYTSAGRHFTYIIYEDVPFLALARLLPDKDGGRVIR